MPSKDNAQRSPIRLAHRATIAMHSLDISRTRPRRLARLNAEFPISQGSTMRFGERLAVAERAIWVGTWLRGIAWSPRGL